MGVPGSVNNLLGAGGAPQYLVERSLRFNSADSAFLSRTPASAGNRKTWTWAGWVKRSGGNEPGIFSSWAGSNPSTTLYFNVDNRLVFYDYNSVYRINLLTTQVFRDFSAWYHIVVAVNTTAATSTDRVKIYVNGVQITAFDTATYPALDWETNWNSIKEHNIGKHVNYQEGYLADVHFIDGQALTPSSFTEVSATTGQLIPKAYTDVLPGPVTLVPSIAEGALIIKADAGTITGSVTAAGFVKVHSSSDGINWTYREQILSGALSFSAKYIAIGGGSTNSRTFNPSTGGSYTWAEYSAGIQFDTTSNITLNVTGLSYTANSTVTAPFGTNGFWLKFSDNSAATATTLGKDYSGNSNNWTPNNLSVTTYGTSLGVYAITSNANTVTTFPNDLPYTAIQRSALPSSFSTGTSNFVPASGITSFYMTMFGATNPTGPWTHLANWTQSETITSASYSSYNYLVFFAYNVSPTTNRGNHVCTVSSALASGTNAFYAGAYPGSDTLVDTPTSYGTDTGAGGEVRGNYATLNPLAKTISSGVSSDAVVENGNLFFRSPGTYRETFPATMAIAGKTYFEGHVSATSSSYWQIGLLAVDQYKQNLSNVDLKDYGANCFTWYASNGNVYVGSSLIRTTTAPGADAIVGLAFDPSTGDVYGYINGSVQNSGNPIATLSTSKTYIPAFLSARNDTDTWVNFGQRQWAYQAPAGFKALCTTNLPEPTIALPSTVMDVKLYTGNSSTQTISGLGFSPDLVWIKQRSGAQYHTLQDTVRGATNDLYSNATDAESTYAQSLNAFNSDGFTVGSLNWVNQNSQTYVAWTWDAGSSTTTNNSGSISSQVRANASAGFSIVTYTGTGSNATVGHGLGVAPSLIIVKNRTSVANWSIYHSSIGAAKRLKFTTDAEETLSVIWNNTSPSSTVFSLGTSASVNESGSSHVAYCFAPVAGYSSFGSYTGNSSTDGPFVYTGFRPRWILIKMADTLSTYPWEIYDTARSTYNVMNVTLSPNTSTSEPGQPYPGLIDVTANGFKIRSANNTSYINYSAATYIYAAFAESPFQYARAR